jgi:hypothetical protein
LWLITFKILVKYDVPFLRMSQMTALQRSTAVRTGALAPDVASQAQFVTYNFLNNADVVVTPCSIESLWNRPKNTKDEVLRVQAKIDAMEQITPQAQSVIVVDETGKPMLGYFATRPIHGPPLKDINASTDEATWCCI